LALVALGLLPATALLLIRSGALQPHVRQTLALVVGVVSVFAIWNHAAFSVDHARAVCDV
jgi:hypothetical protein